ncbi:MAG: Uma2 family endonuclease [Candidatus Riflebacteria bacterium]|nr:Uma2 family endonuclease [Candidatus Riflebacteria bacterium]
MQSAVEKKKSENAVYGDIISLPDDKRWEIINGRVYDMTPAPSSFHQKVLGNLYRIVADFLDGKSCEVYFSPFDVRLPENDEPDEEIASVVQPDLTVICDKKKIDKKGCRGAPDWIVEILSPFTRKKDLLEKTLLYEKHKVKEYWIIYPDEKFIQVYELENTNSGKEEYVQKRVYIGNAKVPVKVLAGLKIDMHKIFRE